MKKQSLKSLWWIIKLKYKTTKAAFIWDIFYNAYDGIIGIVNTFLTAKMLTSVTEVAFGNGQTSEVYLWLVGLLGTTALSAVLSSINQLVSRRVDQLLELVASDRYYTKLYTLSQQQFEDETFNTSVARAREGLGSLWRVTHEMMWALSSLIKMVTAMVAILVVAPVVGLLVLATIVPISLLRVRQNNLNEEVAKKTEPIERVAWRTRWYLLDPQFMPEVRLLNGFKRLVNIWQNNAGKVNDMMFEVEKRNVRFEAVSGVIGPLVTFLANVHFFRMMAAGVIGLDRFIFLRGVLEQSASASMALASSLDKLHALSIDLGNFDDFYFTDPAIPNGSVKVNAPLTIEFKNVGFTYPTSKEATLKGISFLIVPGSKLALVGENGAGKTTLVKLLLRQYLPTSGQILVNDTDIKDIDQASYYRALSILSQDFLILSHLTIEDNLTIGLGDKRSEKEIRDALEMVGANEYVNKMPHKLAQRLDSSFKDGSNLSGGQMQRLGVARSLLRQADIMVLDEPTSAIDAKAEYNIFNNIYKAHVSKTTLIVSHRFSTVRKADKVIVMEQGKIIEFGSHEELIEHAGLYKEMFEMQAEGYK